MMRDPRLDALNAIELTCPDCDRAPVHFFRDLATDALRAVVPHWPTCPAQLAVRERQACERYLTDEAALWLSLASYCDDVSVEHTGGGNP